MNTKTLSTRALGVIDQYLHFRAGAAVASVPYFNNKVPRSRAALRTYIGKGSPQDIADEVQALAVKGHLDLNVVADESLKKLLVDNNLGIDCSGFIYYVLNAESSERSLGTLDKHIHFTSCHGLIGKLRCSLRPAENCDVATFAHDKNTRVIAVKEVEPGDIITMTDLSNATGSERDHVLIIHQVEYQNSLPTKIHFSHAVAYPTDGIYGSGIRQGEITITNIDKNVTDQLWSESGTFEGAKIIFDRACHSKTELRRLQSF